MTLSTEILARVETQTPLHHDREELRPRLHQARCGATTTTTDLRATNGVPDAAEGGQNLWIVKAFDPSNNVAGQDTATATVNGVDGVYTISGLQAGTTYTVCEFAPAQSPSYLGWIQSVPKPVNTLCSTKTGAELDGYSVTPTTAAPTVTGKDFFNVHTVTIGDPINVNCNNLPPGGVFTVGDGLNEPFAKVTIYAERRASQASTCSRVGLTTTAISRCRSTRPSPRRTRRTSVRLPRMSTGSSPTTRASEPSSTTTVRARWRRGPPSPPLNGVFDSMPTAERHDVHHAHHGGCDPGWRRSTRHHRHPRGREANTPEF